MNVTTFSALKGDTVHFKRTMNTIMWGAVCSNVNYLHFEYKRLKGSSNYLRTSGWC